MSLSNLRRLVVVVALTVTLVGAACSAREVGVDPNLEPEFVGDEQAEDGPSESENFVPSTTPLKPGEVGQLLCGSGAACAEEFELDGIVYSLSCRAVRVDAVLNTKLGSGRAFNFDVEVRGVDGFRPDQIVAISVPGGQCSENDPEEVHTPWSLAFGSGIDSNLASEAACRIGALSPSQAKADGCSTVESDTGQSDGAPSDTVQSDGAQGDGDSPGEANEQSPIDVENVVADFVDALAASAADEMALAKAAAMWSGYPIFEEGEDNGKAKHLGSLVQGNPWLLDNGIDNRIDNGIDLQIVDAWGYAGFEPMKVVSITDPGLNGIFAVLVGGDGLIHRIQAAQVTASEVVIPGGPTEGGVIAYLNGELLPSDFVDFRHESGVTAIEVPPDSVATERRLLVVSVATPELPTAFSVLVPVE